MKGATGIDASEFAKKADLASLKSYVDKLNVDELNIVPAGLSKLNNVMDSDAVKKTVYDKLVTKVNTIDTKIQSTRRLVTRSQYYSDKQGLEKKTEDVDKKIPNTSGLVKETETATQI